MSEFEVAYKISNEDKPKYGKRTVEMETPCDEYGFILHDQITRQLRDILCEKFHTDNIRILNWRLRWEKRHGMDKS